MTRVVQRQLLFWVASFCFIVSLTAQEKDRDFEILGHCIHLQIFPGSNSIFCIDTLSIRIRARKVRTLSFSLPWVFDVEKVNVKEDRVNFKRGRDYVVLQDVPSDSQFNVVIHYAGELSFISEFTRLDTVRAVLREEEILPGGPRAYRFLRLTITVPKDWESFAVGKKVLQASTGDLTTSVWEFDQPVPSIGWICAGKFWSVSDAKGDVPINVHLFKEDSVAAAKIVSLTKDVVRFYNQKFTPYRFPKLDVIQVDNWVAGVNVMAIATPSCIMVKKLAFETPDKFNQVEAVLPHEIAHQWWPATVFVREDYAFLSEGLCEYSSYLFRETFGRFSQRDSLAGHPMLRSLMMQIAQGKDIPLQQKADLRSMPTQYLKAAYVHHMLRCVLGDSVFLKLYHEYAVQFSLKEAGIDDFQKLAEKLSGKTLAWFFDQWVRSKGAPHIKLYNVKSAKTDEQWSLRGRVRIVGYDKYTTFAEVGVKTSEGIRKTRVWLGTDSSGMYRNDVPFEISTHSKPLQVLLDPNGDLLKLQKLAVKFGDLRVPSDGVMIVGTLRHLESLLKLARKDSAEMINIGWTFTIKCDTQVTLRDLQNGRVFLYGNSSENRVALDQQMKFPIKFLKDSVVLKGESIFDASLAVIQIIENPYIARGFICWIVPLSEHAEPELNPYDYSWVLVRGNEIISSGTWEVKDDDLILDLN